MEDIKEVCRLAEEKGREEERLRIAKAFYGYEKRETLPLEVQKDIAKIITVDIQF